MSGATLAVEVVDGNPAERILVIAPTYRVFAGWCQRSGINPRSPRVVCVTRDHHLRGYRGDWYVLLGVAPGDAGDGVLRMLERMKAMYSLKNAGGADAQDA